MDFVSGLVVFILLWWWVFLMSLPFGIKTPDEVESGHATSAPERPMLGAKLLFQLQLLRFSLLIVYWIIDTGFISLSQL